MAVSGLGSFDEPIVLSDDEDATHVENELNRSSYSTIEGLAVLIPVAQMERFAFELHTKLSCGHRLRCIPTSVDTGYVFLFSA